LPCDEKAKNFANADCLSDQSALVKHFQVYALFSKKISRGFIVFKVLLNVGMNFFNVNLNKKCFDMLTTIRGTYSKGQITLLEAPPTEEPMEVLVTFTKVKQAHNMPMQPIFGYSKGIVSYMSPDFDEPLEELKDYM
jgi:hypothetical protein